MTFERAQLLRDVRKGLTATSKTLSPKYFYDETGSELFDKITRLPEYYPTRAESKLLADFASHIVALTNPSTLVELGAGSADKTRLLLDAMVASGVKPASYLAVDVSVDYLTRSAKRLQRLYPTLRVEPVAVDFSRHFVLPPHPAPALHAFLGSTIGNFIPDHSRKLLRSVRARMEPRDSFLLGVDLRKDVRMLESAYNDALGVTARFNRNILTVINHALGADFVPDRFEHRAGYNSSANRIEMRLVSVVDQIVSIPGVGEIPFVQGESILTELSYKYDRATVADLLIRSGFDLTEWLVDDDHLFALALAQPSAE